MEFMEQVEQQGTEVRIPGPRLSPVEKLYVRVFLHTHSHIEAHRAANPTLKKHFSDNPFSRKEAVQFFISQALQEKAEAMSITPELIMEKLYKEATREGGGSNHAARVTALTQMGKHLGMFVDKKEDTKPVFNIINYGVEPISLKVQEVKEISNREETYELPEGIELTDFQSTRVSPLKIEESSKVEEAEEDFT